jgi:hypothetical protein
MTTNNQVRSIEEKRRRRRLSWLCIAGGTGALTLVAPAIFVAMGGTLRYPGANYLPNSPPQAWYYVLGIGILLGMGPMLSTVICWLCIVNTAKRVTWYRGLLAGWIASVLAYPLTAIVVVLILSFGEGKETLRPILPQFLLMASIFSFFLLPYFGLYTSILGVLLGSLLGWLQGHDEARLTASSPSGRPV